MTNKEDPKVHCIVLNKLTHNLEQGETEWKLCKVFSTLANSNRRIHREKNATRKYKPVLAFTVPNPSDTDRQALNFNKGIVKDRLGFSVNSETVAALIDGVGDKETQWVLTTSEYLKHFSVQENLTIDTFFETEFEESKLEASLPSLFKLQSVCNRTEVVLASPISKPHTGDDSSKKLKSPSQSTFSQGKEWKRGKRLEVRTISPKVVPDLGPTKSESDINGNCSLAQDNHDDVTQEGNIKDEKLFPVYTERESNSCLKSGHPAKEKQNFTSPIISKIKEELPESPEYDCKPKFVVKVKEEVCEHDFESKKHPDAKGLAGARPQVIVESKEDVSQHDDLNVKSMCSLARHYNDNATCMDNVKDEKKSFPVYHRGKESNSCLKCGHPAKEKHGFTSPIISKIKEESPESPEYDCKPKFMVKVKEEVCEYDLESKHDPFVKGHTGAMPQVIAQGEEEVSQHNQVPKQNSHQHKPHSSAVNDMKCAWKTVSERRENVSETNHQVGHQKHSGDSCYEKNSGPKVKEVRGCSHIKMAFNETHPIEVSGEDSSQKTIQDLRSNILGNCYKTKASSDSNKRDEYKHPDSLEEANLLEQSIKPPVSLTVKTSHSHSNVKRRTSSGRDTASPSKPYSTEQDSTIHKQVSTKCPSRDERSDSRNNNVAQIPKKSGTSTGVHDSKLNKSPLKRPLIPDLPTTKAPRKKLASDSMTASKEECKKDVNSSKLKHHREKLMGKDAKTGAVVKSCSNDKGESTSQSVIDVSSIAGTLKRSSLDSGKGDCGDIKRKKHSSGGTNSLSKLFQGESKRAEYAKISHEDKTEMKALSHTEHVKRNCSTKKSFLEHHGKPQSTAVKSLSEELGSKKTVKEFDKKTSAEKTLNLKSPIETEQLKGNASAKRGILKNPRRVDFKQKRKDNTCETNEGVSFNGKDECGDIERSKHTSTSTNSSSKLFQEKSKLAAFRSDAMDPEKETTAEYAKISHEDKVAEIKDLSYTEHTKGKCSTKKNMLENHGKPQSTTVRSLTEKSGSTKAVKKFDKMTSGDKIPILKSPSESEQSQRNASARRGILKNPCRVDLKQNREENTCGTKGTKEGVSFDGKDECGDIERRTHTSASSNPLSKLFQGKSQLAAFRSLSMDSESTKTTAEFARIPHEGKTTDMKSSYAEQVKGNTAKKGILKNYSRTQSATFTNFSVELGSTKTVFDKMTSRDKFSNLKSPLEAEDSKKNATAKKCILKNPCRVDIKENREGIPCGRKKGVRFNENMSAANGQTLLHTKYHADSQSAGFDLLGSLNTGESFLFNSEDQKEQSAISNLVKAVAESGLCSHTDPNEVKTCSATESLSKDTLFSHLERSAFFSDKERHTEDTKRQRPVDQHSGERNQNVARKFESNGGKGTERQSSPMHHEDPCGQSRHRNMSAENQQNENRHAQQINCEQKQSEVTLLVGDSMLQHIQPEKLFKTKHVVVKTVPGARVDNISEYMTKFILQESPSNVILHVGTNDLWKGIMHIAAHIESVGKLITKTFPSVKKFTISSIIQRRGDIAGAKSAKASDVNKILRNIQLEHGWDYIDNKNIDPEVHLGPDGMHFNAIGIEAFAGNICKHLGLAECGLQNQAKNATLVTRDQLAVHVTSKHSGNSVTPCKDNSGNKNACDKEPVTLLAGDSMLESIKLHEDSTKTHVKRVAVPNARVNTFGNIVIEHAKHHKVGEVILHIGSNDLNDNIFTPKEIAAQIEEIGVDLQKTCPSISKITICGTISRNRGGADDVNAVLKTFKSKHGWGYICNDNVNPKFRRRHFKFKLKGPSAKIFEENVIKYLQSVNLTATCSTDLKASVTQQGNVKPIEESSSKVGTSCEEDVVVTVSRTHLGSDCLLNREPDGMIVLKDQPVSVPEAKIEDTDDTALLSAKICQEASISVKTYVEQEKATLLIGDSMLESIIPQKLSRTKLTKLVVVPDARVDNIGETISKHARKANVDEVILHIGSSDLKNNVYSHKEIATKIEAIGMTLETTCPHIATFTISGVIETFDNKRVNSRNLNTLLKSSTLDHGWAYICNDNIYPTFHMKPFETKLNSCGARLLASNIIGHLRYMKSERFISVSQAPGMLENNDQSSFKDTRPNHCQELVVPGKANKIPLKDPQADKRPLKYLETDKHSEKDLSRKESCDDGLGNNAGSESEPLDGETSCSGGDRKQSQTCDKTYLKPSKRKKHKRRKKNEETLSLIPLVSPHMRVDKSRERPGSKSWPQGANRFGDYPGHKYDYSSAWYLNGAAHGPTWFTGRIPSYTDFGWYYP